MVPVIEGLRSRGAGPLSVDTSKAEVARAALEAGADLVNDVSGFGYDPAMAPLVAARHVPAVLMHLRGGFGEMHRCADVLRRDGRDRERARRGPRPRRAVPGSIGGC